MPDIRAKSVGISNKEVEMRLQITYQRDGLKNDLKTSVVNVRNDVSFYPRNGWKKVKMNEEWAVDFGQEIRGGTALLMCRNGNNTDTIEFHIRGTNPTEGQIKNYMKLKDYTNQYWFIVKMTRQESSMRQFEGKGEYSKKKLDKHKQGKGEPLYGPPKGFGLKQLDNWAKDTKHATEQHLWNWKENIDGGVEVIKEKKAVVDKAKARHAEMIEKWNKKNSTNQVSDSLEIIAGDNIGSVIYTITEGKETFAVSPANSSQRNIYDALWIKLFNGGKNYYQVNQKDTKSKPVRQINRTNSLNKNYVYEVCNRND
jgi:hypothetical protein